LITGGGTGIGAAIARALAAQGAALSLAGRRRAPLEAMAKALPKAIAIVADITKAEDCLAMTKAANAAHGPVDIVIANAGMAASAPIGKIDLGAWRQAIDVNLTGAFLTVQSALADVTRAPGGRVVFVASTAGLKGYPYVAAYVAAKHGVVGLMRALSIEIAAKGVTVNAVCPGFTDTPLLDAAADKIAGKTGRSAGEARAELAKDNAHGRLITPEEVAQTVLWLCSPGAASINGQTIAVTGGPL
jgi:NAD(P)-dependent dehydrogenase (short-subunit alcohol dehydrogenase family)